MASKKETVDTLDNGALIARDVIAGKDQEIKRLNLDLQQVLKERNEKTQLAFDKDKELNKIKSENETKLKELQMVLDTKIKQYELLSSKFNDLAKLFDEYIKGSEDMVSLQQMLLRNNLRTQELLQIKIKAFNGEGDKVE